MFTFKVRQRPVALLFIIRTTTNRRTTHFPRLSGPILLQKWLPLFCIINCLFFSFQLLVLLLLKKDDPEILLHPCCISLLRLLFPRFSSTSFPISAESRPLQIQTTCEPWRGCPTFTQVRKVPPFQTTKPISTNCPWYIVIILILSSPFSAKTKTKFQIWVLDWSRFWTEPPTPFPWSFLEKLCFIFSGFQHQCSFNELSVLSLNSN